MIKKQKPSSLLPEPNHTMVCLNLTQRLDPRKLLMLPPHPRGLTATPGGLALYGHFSRPGQPLAGSGSAPAAALWDRHATV